MQHIGATSTFAALHGGIEDEPDLFHSAVAVIMQLEVHIQCLTNNKEGARNGR